MPTIITCTIRKRSPLSNRSVVNSAQVYWRDPSQSARNPRSKRLRSSLSKGARLLATTAKKEISQRKIPEGVAGLRPCARTKGHCWLLADVVLYFYFPSANSLLL